MLHCLKHSLNDRDSLALQLHVNYIGQNPKDPVNPIMRNFCKRVGCNLDMLVNIVLKGFWSQVQYDLKRDKYIV